ncbi:hypothetical protein FRX31_018189 [Thalictrum thalictroides]|uniref:Uncharacterized protein n=1 Tax=Thalictrum thalictroides TaxID=46969 RepID=A0A7J6W4A8_THATH|nr:hypothetical protein FRX31_018189 [Thalictrum thalictroides]
MEVTPEGIFVNLDAVNRFEITVDLADVTGIQKEPKPMFQEADALSPAEIEVVLLDDWELVHPDERAVHEGNPHHAPAAGGAPRVLHRPVIFTKLSKN